jgi:UrcA family protein
MKHTGSIAALAAAAVAMLAVPALAQVKDKYPDAYGAYDPYDYSDEVVVIAPGVYRDRTGERTAIGARVETLTAHRGVYTGDLNLRYDRDVDVLRSRIRATAVDACNDIERASSGLLLDSDRECVRDAVRSANVEADAMIYAARG